MVFRAKFFEEQKSMDGDKFDRKDAEQLAKAKWAKMGADTKSKYQPKSKEVKKSTKKSASVKDIKKSVSPAKGKKSVSKPKEEKKSTSKPKESKKSVS